jgi:hypothetical protein
MSNAFWGRDLPVASTESSHQVAEGILSQEDRRLCSRVHGEFFEMPGLTLTVPQAARLFNLDGHRCSRILQSLVDSGQLTTDGRVFKYRRASSRCA